MKNVLYASKSKEGLEYIQKHVSPKYIAKRHSSVMEFTEYPNNFYISNFALPKT